MKNKWAIIAALLLSLAPASAAPGLTPWNVAFPVVGTAIGAHGPAGQFAWVAVDTNGALMVNCTGCSGGGGGGAVTQSGTWTVGINTAIPAGTNNIGDVDVLTLPAISGTVSVSNFPATQAATQSGTWNIGSITTLPAIAGTVGVSNFPATQPVSGTVAVSNLPATQPVSGTIAVSNFPATQPVSGTIAATQSGTWNVGTITTLPALVAGNANIGDVDVVSLPSVTVGNFPASQNVVCTSGCAAGTALTTHSAIMAATANPTLVKNAAGTVHTIVVANNSTTIAYLKLYNKATAPTCGTDTPVLRFQVPATAAGPFMVTFDGGANFATGIGYCMVTGIADNSTTAVAASAYLVNLGYK